MTFFDDLNCDGFRALSDLCETISDVYDSNPSKAIFSEESVTVEGTVDGTLTRFIINFTEDLKYIASVTYFEYSGLEETFELAGSYTVSEHETATVEVPDRKSVV